MGKSRKTPPKTQQLQLDSITELGARVEKQEAQGDQAGAAQLYRDWLTANPNSPGRWIALFNLGVLLRGLGDLLGAVNAYQAAIAAHPRQPHARVNLGTTLEVLGKQQEAIDQWKTALSLLDEDPKADSGLKCTVLNNLGRILEILQRYTEAEEMLTRSLLLAPGQEAVLYHRIYLRQKQCAWPIYAPLPGITNEEQMLATSAVAMLSITDDPEVQLRTALSQVPGSIPKNLPKLAPKEPYRHSKLRIGYLSSNFGMHAVSILTAELFELHDRSRVEVWGFCWSPEDNTEMRARVIRAMDHFVRIKDMTDEDAAQAIRSAEIDVLVDLQGLTSGCRPKILAYRPAPVQVTYLGFPGTTGLPEIDYVLADHYIIPEGSAKYFTEKPLYLPGCFQVNDRKRESSPPKSRNEYGLPENAFVFCAFNNNIKFTPEFFAAWMRILHRTENSVLWLLADNEKARENLGRCADEHGVARERLIFAPRIPVADYLARFAVADLFLDLFPFNGGTTAADALWMGCPVLTLSGRSFASRMAGSLLQAIGTPELITTTLEEYENKATDLAANQATLTTIREQIRANRNSSALFDTPATVRNIEASFIAATQQYENAAANTEPSSRSQEKPEVPANASIAKTPLVKASPLSFLPPETRNFLAANPQKRLHLGCGTIFLKGWINVGYWDHLEQGRLYANPNGVEGAILLNHDLRLGLPAEPNSIEATYHSHMLEHLGYVDGLQFLQRIHDVLRKDGVHRILVPDLEAFAKAYVGADSLLLDKYKNAVLKDQAEIYQTKASIFMGMLHNHDHKWGYDWETLHWALQRLGFRNVVRTLFQESSLPDIKEIEEYSPLRALESLCVECIK